MIVGPAGSGRERVARTIHAALQAEGWPYLVPLACPLLDAELLESTVETCLRGCAELSAEQPAILLLLDVDQLPEDAQASLLGLLRIAELRLHTLCTAQRSLFAPSAEGPFRRELAYALSTLEMEIPPLVERLEDLPLLAQAAIEQVNARGNCQRTGLTQQALDCLLRYSWPGNVDELFQLLAEAHASASGPYLTPQDLPERIHAALAAAEYPHKRQESIRTRSLSRRCRTGTASAFVARCERQQGPGRSPTRNLARPITPSDRGAADLMSPRQRAPVLIVCEPRSSWAPLLRRELNQDWSLLQVGDLDSVGPFCGNGPAAPFFCI